MRRCGARVPYGPHAAAGWTVRPSSCSLEHAYHACIRVPLPEAVAELMPLPALPVVPPTPPALIARQPATGAFDLTRYRDRRRVLVLAAPAASDSLLLVEEAGLRARAAGVTDRDLVVVRVLDTGQSSVEGRPLDPADVATLRRRLGLGAGRFTAVLVGKDGHVALRAHAPVVAGRLFPLIDAMPMRRSEMRRGERSGARPAPSG